jgi:Nuclear transport factor 2 (NTF2) domain
MENKTAVGNNLNPNLNLDNEVISIPLINNYFVSINNENFQETVNLFTDDGVMYPPFDSTLLGRDAILAYLENEAMGMKLLPDTVSTQELTTEESHYQVTGKVQTPLFTVNVSWYFVIYQSQILSVKVKLLAALQELLQFKK